MAVALLVEEEEEINRRVWRRQRVFRDRLQPFEIYDDRDLMSRYRMPRHVLMEVIDLIRDRVEHPTNRSHAIPAVLQVLCAIRYYATGSFQLVTGDCGNISQASMSRIIFNVSCALQDVSGRIIRFPMDQAGQNMIKEGFYNDDRRIPNVLGCIDGSLVPIKRPSQNEDAYVCRHQYTAINVQGVCSEDKKFLNIVANWPGSTHDAFIWRQCQLKQLLQNGVGNDGYLLGDSAYPLSPWLMTPVRNPENGAERRYNSHHRRIRQRIEGTFSRWKMRWLCLHRDGGNLTLRPERSCKVIMATAVLHNICEEHGLPVPRGAPPNLVDNPDLDRNPPLYPDEANGQEVRTRVIRGNFDN